MSDRISIAALKEAAPVAGVPLTVTLEGEVLAALVDAVEALREVHEYHCGCDRPGNLSACVCEPQSEFEILARFDFSRAADGHEHAEDARG